MEMLLVEDAAKTAAYLRQGLMEAGFGVDLARNGIDGLALSIDHHAAFLASLLRWLLLGGAAAALLSGALGVWVARRGLLPLQKISANATLISAQRLSDEALAEERGLQLERSGLACTSGDPLMLRRALSNLLANAIRHADTAAASTGLGLGIVKSIVEAHGGSVGAFSSDGETCFRISLP